MSIVFFETFTSSQDRATDISVSIHNQEGSETFCLSIRANNGRSSHTSQLSIEDARSLYIRIGRALGLASE